MRGSTDPQARHSTAPELKRHKKYIFFLGLGNLVSAGGLTFAKSRPNPLGAMRNRTTFQRHLPHAGRFVAGN
jgi:hypothetical protein